MNKTKAVTVKDTVKFDTKVESIHELQKIEPDKLKAAYALNMCTVSVSQIVDYNDIYILEQEYEAILNNLNLEIIPKDDALLKTLTEILNTITFFRIQEIKKQQLEKEYQHRMKNAIWSAVPNLSVVATGNPVGIGLALATQFATGYMNYRKERANAIFDKEKSETELQITAIEQLNALRRELFTSAWRLAEKYEFPDCLRLTEKQITQYNTILMDTDELRKYARLETIQNKFLAYPPFWYYFAHTALSIAAKSKDDIIQKNYIENAKKHFEQYQNLNTFNILREDQIAASADLEYVTLLLEEGRRNSGKIAKIIDDAVEKSGNANDVLQICAINYLRIGEYKRAEKIFKILVNEDYNTNTNAKFLSRLYVNDYIDSKDENEKNTAYSDYCILKDRIEYPELLYPMPVSTESKNELDEKFLLTQKVLLKKEYRLSLNEYKRQNKTVFSKTIIEPFEVLDGEKAKNKSVSLDKGIDLGTLYIDILNKTVSDTNKLSNYKNSEKNKNLINYLERRIKSARKIICDFQTKLDSYEFNLEDFYKLKEQYNYEFFTEVFFDEMEKKIDLLIDEAKNLEEINSLEVDLIEFCKSNNLVSPEKHIRTYDPRICKDKKENEFFEYSLLSQTSSKYISEDTFNSVISLLKNKINEIVKDPTKVSVYLSGEDEFASYFSNEYLKSIDKKSNYLLEKSTFAIIDDKTKKDYDLMLCKDGVKLVDKNIIYLPEEYKNIRYSSDNNRQKLSLKYPDIYTNKNVNISLLYNIINNIAEELEK